MSSEAADPETIKQTIIQFLDLLGFRRFLQRNDPCVMLNSQFFENFEGKHFRLLTYFLFVKLYGAKAVKAFRSVFPSRDIQQQNEFKKIAIDWINDLSSKHPEARIGKVLPILFHRFSGEKFLKLMFRLVIFVAKHLHSNALSDYSSMELKDCENHTKQKTIEKETLAAKRDMYNELLAKKLEELSIWVVSIQEEEQILERLPSKDDTQLALEETMKDLSEVMSSLDGLSIVNNPSDAHEKWDYSLTTDNEKALAHRFRDCLTLFERFIIDPKRFQKELKKFSECEKLLDHIDKLNKVASKHSEELRKIKSKLENDILTSSKAQSLRQELEKEYLQIDYTAMQDTINSALIALNNSMT